MSKAAASPTARLLQTSRLFSLPRPLPAPPLEGLTSTGVFRGSDTATTPYPTHQAITTPQSSLSRGDFGLKRALPAKTTRNTSTPHIRVKAQDTYEHVTEFASAADHTQSREKWMEMGIPIMKPTASRMYSKTPQSVFEEHIDNTDPDSLVRLRPVSRNTGQIVQLEDAQRWKYTAPHVGAMPPGEFQMWLDKTITPKRRAAWNAHLRQHVLEKRLQNAQVQARREGRALTEEQKDALRAKLLPTDKDLQMEKKLLREAHQQDRLSSELSALLTKFLDLPSLSNNAPDNPAVNLRFREEVAHTLPTLAPPTTHPSAGLSHLRTNAIMENHPIFGPQKHRAPVQARVVEPRDRADRRVNNAARLGIGGFVADDPNTNTFVTKNSPEADKMAAQLEHNLEGGNKMWVHPQYATVDDKGRVKMQVSRAEKEEIAVKQGDEKAIGEIVQSKNAGLVGGWSGGSVNRTTPAASRVQGFDLQNANPTSRDVMDLLKKEQRR